jgi:hypothetical protein
MLGTEGVSPMEGDWISLAALGSFSGVVFTVTVVSQFLKGLVDKVVKLPTRLLVLSTSWGVLLGYRYVMSGTIGADGVFLDVLNGFLVSLTAMGAHTLAKDKLGWK